MSNCRLRRGQTRLQLFAALAAITALTGLQSPAALTAHATAQGPKDKKDPQAKFEPRSAPGAGQMFLAKFVGEWDVVKTFYPRAGKPFVQKGVCKQEMINDGRFLQSSFTFRRGDAKTTGLGLIGFEAASGTFTSVWADARATRMSFRKSKGKFDGEQIVLYGAALGEVKPERESRTVTKLEDGGKKIVHRQYTIGRDGKERLVMELLLTRKAGR